MADKNHVISYKHDQNLSVFCSLQSSEIQDAPNLCWHDGRVLVLHPEHKHSQILVTGNASICVVYMWFIFFCNVNAEKQSRNIIILIQFIFDPKTAQFLQFGGLKIFILVAVVSSMSSLTSWTEKSFHPVGWTDEVWHLGLHHPPWLVLHGRLNPLGVLCWGINLLVILYPLCVSV